MVRDDAFIRKILLDLEASEETLLVSVATMDQDEEEEKLHYHVQLLCDAGLMTPVGRGTFRMTNQGHDFVAAVRDETIWKKTREGAAQVGGVTLGVLKDIAVAYVKQEVRTKLGLEL